MDLAFFTKFLANVRNQALVFLKRSCTLGKLVKTQIKVRCYVKEKIIFVSVAFLMALSICEKRSVRLKA